MGTGTGVLPRKLYSFDAKWTGCDISENQIEQAKILANQNDMNINFFTCATENLISSHKAYHAKDDVKALRNILHQLKELGGDYGFNSDFKTNPQGKMRCMLNSDRKRKIEKKAFSSRRNDREFELGREPERKLKREREWER